MKSYNIIALAFAAAACCFGTAEAQQNAAPSNKVKAYVQFKGGKPMNIELEPTAEKNAVVYVDKNTEQQMKADASKCSLFYIQTPADLAAATKAYTGQDFAAARKQLAACKEKYKGYVGLPGNPCTAAAVTELECAVRQMDWDGLKGLVASFPEAAGLEFNNKTMYDVAGVMSKISDDPGALESVKAAVEPIAKDKYINSAQYGWLMYALGRAYAAQVPAAELDGSVSDANLANANQAIDHLCQAAISSHGAMTEIPVDAMMRAVKLLWAMPGVKEFASQASKLDVAKWNAAPHNFRDAVSLAFLLKNVYKPDLNDQFITRVAGYHVNSLEGKEKAAK